MIIDLLSGLSSQSWSAAAAVARGQWGIVVAPQYGDNTRTPLHLTSNIIGDSVPAKASISSDHCIRCGARSLVPVRSWSVVQPYLIIPNQAARLLSRLQKSGHSPLTTLDLESTTFRAKQYLKILDSEMWKVLLTRHLYWPPTIAAAGCSSSAR